MPPYSAALARLSSPTCFSAASTLRRDSSPIGASGSLLQRRLDLPDATVMVLQGILFVVILGFETFSGRIKIFQTK